MSTGVFRVQLLAAHDPIGAASSPRRECRRITGSVFVRMPLKRRCRPSWRRSRTGRRPPDAHQLAAWRMPYQKLCLAVRVPGSAWLPAPKQG